MRFGAPFIDTAPGALAKRFVQDLPSLAEDSDQLRRDLWTEREREDAERREEIQRLDAQLLQCKPEDSTVFCRSRDALMNAMAEFQAHVPGHDTAKGALVSPPRSWDDVERAVADVQKRWSEKPGSQVREWLRKMCTGMSNHKAVLELLPSGSEYVSLIVGSVTMIIQASATHTNVTEGFAKGVVDINDAVNFVQRSQIYRTSSIEQLAMRLYTQVFAYLTKCMRWFASRSRTRFLQCFNGNLHAVFQDDLAEVKSLSLRLSQLIQMHMAADGRAARLIAEGTHDNVRYLIDMWQAEIRESRTRNERTMADFGRLVQDIVHQQYQKSASDSSAALQLLMAQYDESRRQAVSATSAMNLLTLEERRMLSRGNSPLPDVESAMGSPRDDDFATFLGGYDRRDRDRVGSSLALSGEAVMYHSQHLEDYFDWDQVYPFDEPPRPMFAQSNFVQRLNAFTTSSTAEILWAHAFYQPPDGNVLRNSAGGYSSLARESNLPVISYFCDLDHADPGPGRTRETVALCGLVASMIRQLVGLLPPTLALPPEVTLDKARFQRLDGTLRTWDEATSLLIDVSRCINLPVLLFVVDGLNVLEDENTKLKLTELVRCLRRIMENSDADGRITKILLTTVGSSLDGLEDDETVLCELVSPRIGVHRKSMDAIWGFHDGYM